MHGQLLVLSMIALAATGCTRPNDEYEPTASAMQDGVAAADSWFALDPALDAGPGVVCGNGICELGETALSCPADCQAPPCPAGATSCTGEDTIRYCKEGSWRSATCHAVCLADGYHYSTGCSHAPSLGKQACLCGRYAGFGELCDDVTQLCAQGLFCGIFSGAKVGFCTRHCSTLGAACPGAPAGTLASCSLQSAGKRVCGFHCFPNPCPAGLTCDLLSRLCKP